VAVVVTPTGSNFDTALPRTVSIRLARPGIILPPNGTPVPVFYFSPTLPKAHETILFDGSQSVDDGQIVSYFWNFGDGAAATGVSAIHTFDLPGTYNVVLTVTDDRGLATASAPKPVLVSQATAPMASFTASPTDPVAGVTVVQFNGSASIPSPGHHIESLEWDFGDGSPHVFGETASHTYTTPGTYTVVLVVTDSTGQRSVASKTVTVATP
jgi:chitinase